SLDFLGLISYIVFYQRPYCVFAKRKCRAFLFCGQRCPENSPAPDFPKDAFVKEAAARKGRGENPRLRFFHQPQPIEVLNMATTIDQAFIKQFEREVHEAFQRQGSKLRNTVRSINNVNG